MTLIKWTRLARSSGFGFHFGALKGLAYYREKIRSTNNQEFKVIAVKEIAKLKKSKAIRKKKKKNF